MVKKKSITLKEILVKYLKENGISMFKDICSYINTKRPGTTENSISVTLYCAKDIFQKCGYGMWNLINGSLANTEEKLVCKLSTLVEHYQKKLKDKKLNGDTRLAGVDFSEFEKEIIKKCQLKYKKK